MRKFKLSCLCLSIIAFVLLCKDGDAMVRPPDKRCQIW